MDCFAKKGGRGEEGGRGGRGERSLSLALFSLPSASGERKDCDRLRFLKEEEEEEEENSRFLDYFSSP